MNNILLIIEKYLQKNIAAKAEIMDQNSEALKIALEEMSKLNLLGLKLSKKWGGSDLTELEFRQFQIMIARYSGALAFLQTQHQSAVSLLEKSENEALKNEILPHVSSGKILLGVGFSQLRRQGKPLLCAIPTAGGYNLKGNIPWITGYGFFHHFIIGASLPDGQELFAILPFQPQNNLEFSDIMELAVMQSTNTVAAKLDNYFLENSQIITIKPQNSIHENDKKNVLHHGFFALGCAFSALNILDHIYQKKQLSFLENTLNILDQEVNLCQEKMFSALNSFNYNEKLKLRCQAINLALKCSQAAIIATSGNANYLLNPANRVYREALMFSVSGQTTDVMESSLKYLTFCH